MICPLVIEARGNRIWVENLKSSIIASFGLKGHSLASCLARCRKSLQGRDDALARQPRTAWLTGAQIVLREASAAHGFS